MLDMGSVLPEREIIVSSLQQVFENSMILFVIWLYPTASDGVPPMLVQGQQIMKRFKLLAKEAECPTFCHVVA